jgi:hypothetical protein
MNTDPIVQEVRDACASIAAEFGHDLSKYLAWIREQTRLQKWFGCEVRSLKQMTVYCP